VDSINCEPLGVCFQCLAVNEVSARYRRRIECEYLFDLWSSGLVCESGKLRQAPAQRVPHGNNPRRERRSLIAIKSRYSSYDEVNIASQLTVAVINNVPETNFPETEPAKV